MPTKVKYYETFGQATAGLLINLVFIGIRILKLKHKVK